MLLLERMVKLMINFLQKELRKYGVNLDEQVMATVLGAVVVLVVGVLAYGYFRYNQPNTAAKTEEELKLQDEGVLGASGATVALPTTHKVETGENLWTIAEKYYSSGYNFVDIAEANNLVDANSIETGQSLKIPKVEPKQMTVKKTLVPEITLNRIGGTQYTVVKGDYLWEIALRAYGDGYKWTEVSKANNLENPNLIHPGNVFKLPR